MNRQLKARLAPRNRQQGAIMVLFTLGILAVLAIGGLALDMSHALLNKSRLQNTVDAAALAGAKVLDDSKDIVAARAAALAMFNGNAATAGNGEMEADVDPDTEVFIEFSANLEPFIDTTVDPLFVRVRVEQFTMPAFLIQVLGFEDKTVRASAVAGPTPTLGKRVCDLAPMIVCGDPNQPPDPLNPQNFWGYNEGEINVLKKSSENGSAGGDIGPGNFALARLGDSTGGSDMRVNAAGGYEGCAIAGEDMPTEPGNSVGPFVQGMNTRLNCPGNSCGPFKNQTDIYPPDVIVEDQGSLLQADGDQNITLDGKIVQTADDIPFNFDDYETRINEPSYDISPDSGGEFYRRNLTITVADCTGKDNGATELPILGFGCYFLLQEITQSGLVNEAFGQFVSECEASGRSGPTPGGGPGPTEIQLYKDPDSRDS
jgi:hypothetical protein